MIEFLFWFMRYSTRSGWLIRWQICSKVVGLCQGVSGIFFIGLFGGAGAFWVTLSFITGSSLEESREKAYWVRQLAAAIGKTCTQHDVSGQILDHTQKAWFTVRQGIMIEGIYHWQVYTRYILCIYHAKVICEPLSCPSALGSLRPGLP